MLVIWLWSREFSFTEHFAFCKIVVVPRFMYLLTSKNLQMCLEIQKDLKIVDLPN